MAVNSAIGWCHHTWNWIKGCRKISEGCKYCYAEKDFIRWQIPGGFNNNITRTKNMNIPLKWASRVGYDENFFYGMRILSCSWSDWFIQEADPWRDQAWDVVRQTPEFNYLILTKRMHETQYILDRLPSDWGDGWDNVWLGTSVENQNNFDLRVRVLASIPAKIKFLSAEPLIAPINMRKSGPHCSILKDAGIHWVIIGGESGNETGKSLYRPCETEWIYSIMRDCYEQDVAVFVKQLGTHLAKQFQCKSRHGTNPLEWPLKMRIQEFPYHQSFKI